MSGPWRPHQPGTGIRDGLIALGVLAAVLAYFWPMMASAVESYKRPDALCRTYLEGRWEASAYEGADARLFDLLDMIEATCGIRPERPE